MNTLPQSKLLEFHPDTLQAVRKEFNLDKPGRVDEAIDILEEWTRKQNHFTKRNFSRDYLERTIITTKGSVERAKIRLDKLCTYKTLIPNFFEISDIENEFSVFRDVIDHAHLPKLTKDNYRVYFFKIESENIESTMLLSYYKYIIFLSEYIKNVDYCSGFYIVLDYTKLNIMDFITKLNLVELRQALALLTEGYGMRIKGIHFITPSKMIDTFISIFKQVLSEKLASRIHVHKTVETLYEHLPKEILPQEYGGEERSLKKLNEEWINAITSEEHVEYMKEMSQAKTNESCRQSGKFNEQYIGVPGSFRTLSVD